MTDRFDYRPDPLPWIEAGGRDELSFFRVGANPSEANAEYAMPKLKEFERRVWEVDEHGRLFPRDDIDESELTDMVKEDIRRFGEARNEG